MVSTTLSINDTHHCNTTIMLTVIILSVTFLFVDMLSVVTLRVIMHSAMALFCSIDSEEET
jgi:hypothetical protein